MILLDTSVLVYAVGADHPLREPSRHLVESIGAGRLAATTTVEVIQEFAHVCARRRPRAQAGTLALSFVSLLSPLSRPDDVDVSTGLAIFVDNERSGAFDSILAAVAIRAESITSLVSADKAFGRIAGLNFTDLSDTAAVRALR